MWKALPVQGFRRDFSLVYVAFWPKQHTAIWRKINCRRHYSVTCGYECKIKSQSAKPNKPKDGYLLQVCSSCVILSCMPSVNVRNAFKLLSLFLCPARDLPEMYVMLRWRRRAEALLAPALVIDTRFNFKSTSEKIYYMCMACLGVGFLNSMGCWIKFGF